ncbi:MAG: RHS repeat-associated core domain-containing protein [Hyphomicrobium sp.]|nr:RHS repeat-associated core domain-containing protein [Hyphomicrobium sp.]
MKTVAASATVRGTYVYNGFEQLISRVITNSGTANGPLCVGASDAHPHPRRYFVHDLWDNVIAELTTAGAPSYLPASGRTREYIYLPEAEIAPTRQSRTQVDRPVAVVDAVNTATPATLMVHVDHLNRAFFALPTPLRGACRKRNQVRMTNSAKASVWDVTFTPWGAFHSATGARPLGSPLAGQTLNTRFPGQWFQLESGLHYNWHRHYDPSLGRYTQPDPLGFVDGPSVYAYVGNAPVQGSDPEGLMGRYTVPCGRCTLTYDSDQFKGAHTHWNCPGEPQGCIKKDGTLCDGSKPPPPEVKQCLENRKRIPTPDTSARNYTPWIIGGACVAACILAPQFCLPAAGAAALTQ